MAIYQTGSVNPQTKAMQPIQATAPSPGGPNPSDPKDVRAILAQELVQAGQIATQTQSALGVQQARKPIAERAIKIVDTIIAKDEHNSSRMAQNDAINMLLQQTAKTNTFDYAVKKSYINDRLNHIRMELIKIANEFDKRLAQEKASRDKKMQIAGNLGGIASAIAGGVIGAYAGGPAGAALGASTVGAAGIKIGEGVGSLV